MKKYIIMLDEQGRYRLIKHNGVQYDEVLDMAKFPNKETAKKEYQRLYNLTDQDV